MHVNKFLYRHFHSWHHRLYVPYAFGSQYNHPVEGFLLDALGAVMAEAVSGMTTRQAMLLFSFSTFKTVDDHCGYRLPFDPFQLITGNNADYHDIHHQVCVYAAYNRVSSSLLFIMIGDWDEIKLCPTVLRALGSSFGNSHDTPRHRGA